MTFAHRSMLLAITLLLTLGVACRSPEGGESGVPAAEASELPQVDEGSGADQVAQAADDAEGPAIDRYPQLLFALLEPDERARFVRLAGSELCPCEGQISSLDECLQAVETSCELALMSADVMMRLIKEDADDVEILDAAQQIVANLQRVHEFDLENTQWKGADEPAVVVVEFADFQCPLGHVISRVAADYGDNVRFYFKHFPLGSHPNALVAAAATVAAQKQGRFWEFHDLVFENQAQLNMVEDPSEMLMGFAEELGLNLETFRRDIGSDEVLAQVAADRAEGEAAGLMATPTVFIDGVMVLEGLNEAGLRERLDRALAE